MLAGLDTTGWLQSSVVSGGGGEGGEGGEGGGGGGEGDWWRRLTPNSSIKRMQPQVLRNMQFVNQRQKF